MRLRLIIVAAAALFALPLTCVAGELTAITTLDTFTSSGDLYGPWQTELLEYQWEAGKKDIPSITLLNRNDNDRNILGQPVRTRSTAVYVDDYHNWSPSFFTYAQVMTSDGNVLPNRLIYVEADPKFGRKRNLVVGVGGSVYANPDGSHTRSLSIGPTLYEGYMVYTIKYLPAAVTGTYSGFDRNGLPIDGTVNAWGSGLEVVAEYNRLGKDQIIATYLGGHQPGVIVGGVGQLPSNFTNIQHIGEFDLSIKHWVNKGFGFILGGSFGSHALQASGLKLYDFNGITAGVFVGHAVGLP